MNRRDFLNTTGTLALGLTATPFLTATAADKPPPSASHLPRWRGFNLLEKFTKWENGNPPFQESDFIMMAEWGFDFARLPMSYLCWTDPADWLKLREPELNHVDAAVELGRQHGIHVNLNLHRAPGYCVNPPKEPLDLWKDDKALEACAFHWQHFALRYKGIPNERLSFDLLNEPPAVPEATYVRVVEHLVQAIRLEDPQRLVIADGLKWGNDPIASLAKLGIAQSTRGYYPMQVTHYRASWVHGEGWPEPTWPLKEGNRIIDKQVLRAERIQPWKEIQKQGVGVHVGEWGVFNRTPHAVALAFMRDYLDLWREAGWGWALWNLRGSFGVLDSQREDVNYEDFRGHKLDRRMLEVLRG
ncbi:MAG TPA: cellulase family glycosylhydrolase [Candidatus Acidoferrum sp.]|jgi:endoglucanase|nr:cellulase family glycosylhydrolase [Candidatus Acidoferrum sp.]